MDPRHRGEATESAERVLPAQPLEASEIRVAGEQRGIVADGERRQVRVGREVPTPIPALLLPVSPAARVRIELARDQKDGACANDALLVHGDVAVRE